MSGTSALYSRLQFVFVLVCAAVMPLIMCSDAARASPITTQVDNGARPAVLRRPYTPHSQPRPLVTGLPSLQTGANGEPEMSGNYRKTLSIIYRHLKPLRLTKGSLASNNNSPVNRQSRAGTTSLQSGTSPESGDHPLSYNSYPDIIKKSSYKEAAGPFHQSSGPSEVCDAKEAQKSHIKENVPLFLSRTGRYRSASLPTSSGLYSGYKEPNELTSAGTRSTSSGTQSSKSFDLARQTAPRAPSISSSSDASVIKSVPSREKLTPSITDFFLGLHPVSGSETPRHKKIQSDLSKDSQTAFGGHEAAQRVPDDGPWAFPSTSHKRRALEVLSRFSSNSKRLQQMQRKDPTEEVQHPSDANPLYHIANETHYGAQTDGSIKISAPGKDATVGSFVPGNSAAGSSTSAVSSFSNATTRGSTHARGYSFKIPNMNPLSPKYSFGQRKASVAKPEGAPADPSSPSPGTHQDLTSGFKEARPGLPVSDAGVESNPDHSRFRTNRRIDGLKASGTRSLEGAKTLVSEPDESARVQQGFKLPSSQIWEPKSSHINPTSPTEPSREKHPPLLSIPSAYLRSAVKLNIQSTLKSEPKTSDRTKPLAKQLHLLHSSTSNTVRGRRVRGRAKKLNESTPFTNTRNDPIRRHPRLRAMIVGSGVKAATRSPITPDDKDASDASRQKKGASHEAFNSEEAVRRGDDTGRGPEVDNDMKTSDLFLGDEGSGSRGLDVSEVLSTKSHGLGEDVPEPEYLRISPRTDAFKSISLSRTDTQEKPV